MTFQSLKNRLKWDDFNIICEYAKGGGGEIWIAYVKETNVPSIIKIISMSLEAKLESEMELELLIKS